MDHFKAFTEAQLATAVSRHVAPKEPSLTFWVLVALVAWVASLFCVEAIRPAPAVVDCHDVPAAYTTRADTFASAVATES
jgi:hypothetical protein